MELGKFITIFTTASQPCPEPDESIFTFLLVSLRYILILSIVCMLKGVFAFGSRKV
jgi:hypothetical protein